MAPSKDADIAGRFGENLRRARRTAGLTQEEVAARSGLHRTAVGLVEHGERAPQLDTIIKLAEAVGTPVRALFDGMRWEIGDAEFRLGE
jgi:transcriptional regulator with XRE-family HTH domain